MNEPRFCKAFSITDSKKSQEFEPKEIFEIFMNAHVKKQIEIITKI